jgi:hypothetical protein
MNDTRVAVACRNASGMSDLPIFVVTVSPEEWSLGIHYDRAEALAEEAGYEGPFVCFDAHEYGTILEAARRLDRVPQVVAIDFTEGQVQSVCCDAGKIKVICYDTSHTEENADAIAELPVGENGQIVRCWAHVQNADVDPGLTAARD